MPRTGGEKPSEKEVLHQFHLKIRILMKIVVNCRKMEKIRIHVLQIFLQSRSRLS